MKFRFFLNKSSDTDGTRRCLRFMRLERRCMLSADFGEDFFSDDDFEPDDYLERSTIEALREAEDDDEYEDDEYEHDDDESDEYDDDDDDFTHQSARSELFRLFSNDEAEIESDDDEEVTSNTLLESNSDVEAEGESTSLDLEADNQELTSSNSESLDENSLSGANTNQGKQLDSSLEDTEQEATEETGGSAVVRNADQDVSEVSPVTNSPSPSNTQNDWVNRSSSDAVSTFFLWDPISNSFVLNPESFVPYPSTDLASNIDSEQPIANNPLASNGAFAWLSSFADDLSVVDEALTDWMLETEDMLQRSVDGLLQPGPWLTTGLVTSGLAAQMAYRRRRLHQSRLEDDHYAVKFDARLYPEVFG